MDEQNPDTEQRILDAAHAVFLRRGTSGARMQEIADEAGVNKALLHYYFRSKDRLAEAVFERAFRELLPAVLGTLGSELSVEEKVERVIAIELETLRRAPFLPGYVISELHQHPDRITQMLHAENGPAARFPGVMRTLGQQLDERAAAGTLRPIDPATFTINLLSLCVFPFVARPLLGAVFGWDAEQFEGVIDERAASLAGFFLNALRP